MMQIFGDKVTRFPEERLRLVTVADYSRRARAVDLHTGPGLAIPGRRSRTGRSVMPGISLGGRRGCRRLGGIAAVPRG